jgi:hypothetical protein
MSRDFLVTKFVCAKCGTNLSLTYDVPTHAGSYSQGEPTGATMVEQLVAVDPCEKCLKPLEQVRSAISILMKNGGAS